MNKSFFSIRRRHTIYCIVTVVQTCALPISRRSRRACWLIERALWRRPGHPRSTPCAVQASRHSPRQAVQRQSRLANTAHSTSMLPTRQQSAAPACSGRCGAAAPPPRPVHGAGERRHGLPPAAGGAHFPKEAPDAPSAHAALRSAAHGPRHAKPTLSLPKRLSAEGLAARTRLLRGHALRPGERGAGTQPFLFFSTSIHTCSGPAEQQLLFRPWP